MLVNELFIGDHAKINRTCVQRKLHRKGGFQQHLCYMTFEQQCSYKYLLNSASIGYANKFKYLLLCGSVVIYVQDGMAHKEFYEYGLVPGIHYVTVPNAAAVPAMVRWLQAHDSYARAVAAAGRARMATLTTEAVGDFFAELFTQARHVDVRRTTPSCCCGVGRTTPSCCCGVCRTTPSYCCGVCRTTPSCCCGVCRTTPSCCCAACAPPSDRLLSTCHSTLRFKRSK